jgi:exoribonuclease R
MTQIRIQVQPIHDFAFEQGIRAIRQELELPSEFSTEVIATAVHAAANPRLPDLDRTELPLITIDPPGAMDLDQAMLLERTGNGYRVHYAIADVAAFVAAGDAVDVEANRRGQTLYGADSRIPLHPPVLSEDAASLLPMQMRPALLWTIDLDERAEIVGVDVRRARVMSRARFDYASVQRDIDADNADPMWLLLREIGVLRKQLEIGRGGVSLALPAQEIGKQGERWHLTYRSMEPVETWNAQISLLTGMAAARLMIRGNVGLLRTLPPPASDAIARLRLTARALDIPWPDAESYPDFIRTLDPRKPRHVAMMTSCTTVLRGAGYAAFSGALPEQAQHSALAAPYAHVTAPLRRLADRYAGEICLALCAGEPVPEWTLAALAGLPMTMRSTDRRAGHYQRAIIDLTEALILAPRIGESFEGSVIASAAGVSNSGTVMLRDLAIEARFSGAKQAALGDDVSVELVEADPVRRAISFELLAVVQRAHGKP